MVMYIKRRCIDKEAGSENEPKLSEPSTTEAVKEVTDKNIRLYNNSYLAMRFTSNGDENCPLPLHIVCGKNYQIRLWSWQS
jgi:hypothetical protein